jgi:hypothetical protein
MLVAASATNGDVFMLDSALSYATGTEATRLWYAYITAGPDIRESLSVQGDFEILARFSILDSPTVLCPHSGSLNIKLVWLDYFAVAVQLDVHRLHE